MKCTFPISGNQKITRHQIEEWRDTIESGEDIIREVLREQTTFHERVIEESFSQQSTIDAKFALDNDIIEEIKEQEIALGVQIVHIRDGHNQYQGPNA